MSSVSELVARRELLWNLTLRELRGRYKRSILGWGWSLLNPIAFMLIYTFAFGIIMDASPETGNPSGIDSFPFYLMSALLPWTFFLVAVQTSMVSIVASGALVRKVAFPREHLVLSTILAGLFTLAIELTVLGIALLFTRNNVIPWLLLAFVVSVILAVFATGFGLALAAANVYFRDLNYLWGIIAQVWFFATPIVYPASLVAGRFDRYPFLLKIYNNLPMAVFVRIYRNLLYDMRLPAARDVAMIVCYSVASMLVGWIVFNRLEGRFAEEL